MGSKWEKKDIFFAILWAVMVVFFVVAIIIGDRPSRFDSVIYLALFFSFLPMYWQERRKAYLLYALTALIIACYMIIWGS